MIFLYFKIFIYFNVKNPLQFEIIIVEIMLLGFLYCFSSREQWDQFWIERMKLRHKLLYVSSLVSNFVRPNFRVSEKLIFTGKLLLI